MPDSTRGLTTVSRLVTWQMRGALVAGDVITTATADAEGPARTVDSDAPRAKATQVHGEADQTSATEPGHVASDDAATPANTRASRTPRAARQQPVSYTHLTLPTIYSV